VLVGVAALLAPLRAGAQAADSDHPLYKLVERERGPRQAVRRVFASGALGGSLTRLPTASLGPSPLDCVHADHDVALDPESGATTARLDLEVRARGGTLGSVGFMIDEGLTVSSVTADGRTTSVRETVTSPSRVVAIDLAPPLADGESTKVHVAYGGTLACSPSPDTGAIVCAKGQDFSYFSHQSIFPFLFDPVHPDDATLDTMTRDIVLHVPAGADVVATGERVSDTTDGAVHTSTWTIDRPLSRVLGLYAFAGKLGQSAVPGRSVPTSLVYPAPEADVDQRLVSWSAPVLDFVEKLGGTRLPFQRSMTLVHLPADLGDPGTATFGMTLLSDTYQRAGDLMHEETWLHENSHLFWGIVVPETSSLESRLMSEGLATLSEIEYTHAQHFADEDRDAYLARRFVPIGIDLRTDGKDLPPVQLAPHQPEPDALRTPLYTMWAYYKTAATLDHLRETIGDDAFEQSLGAYVDQCKFTGCGPTEFRGVLERTTGKDLGSFFDRWITGSTRPIVTIALRPGLGGADVDLVKDDDATMTLSLRIRLEDGQTVKRRVDLAGRTTTVHVEAPQGVRSVTTSPRHDVLVDARPAVEGDLDFDGETDGFDMLRCSRLVGTAYKTKGALGLWDVSESFDPRCDVNGDLSIDDEDLMILARTFGTLRAS
jgi:hypothetical protein